MSNYTRRKFIKAAGASLVASTTAPFIIRDARAASPSETVNVGVVGVGGRGSGLARGFAKIENTRLVAICDVDPQRLAKTAQKVSEAATPKQYTDYRKMLDDKDIDAVVIATCDHWHTPVALAAIMAGKHVYVEKPSSHTVHEANLLMKAAKQYNKCVQHGTQRRSSTGYIAACKALREGIIGDVYLAKVINHQRRRKIGRAEPTDPPPGVNYDRWLGPAPKVRFTKNRWHYKWHWFWDYGGGDLVNDGIHHLDLAMWGMGVDKQYPTDIVTSGGQLWYDDDHETPDTQTIVYVYPKVQVMYEMRLWTPYDMGGYGNATVFYGTDGYMEGSTAVRGDEKIQVKPEDYGIEPVEGISENFIKAVRHDDPSMLNSPIEIGGFSAIMCNLGNIGTRLGNASLTYDPAAGKITRCSRDISKANAMLTKHYRKPYTLPYRG
jgi:predicted dehydrogenase